MMDPRFRGAMRRCAAWLASIVPRTLTAIIRSQSSTVTVEASPGRWMAAGWARTSSPPISSAAASNARVTSSALETSTFMKPADPGPARVASRATRSPASWSRSMPMTRAPAVTYARTVAAPIPRALPVTMIL